MNDAPSFTGAGAQSVLEDAGAQSVQWATAISAGPADESAQTVAFSASNDNNGLFSVQPAVSSAGVLSYTPAANASGSATVTVTAQDNGGTANGGDDTTSSSFTITVGAVNDAPSFTGAGAQSVLEDAGAQSVQWATAISPGPADESAQTVAFSATNDNNGLFSVQPAVSSAGVLSYTPAANASGSATVTVTAQDNGGTANGGDDTTSSSFTITVTPVNDAPTIAPIANQSINEDDGVQSVSATTLSPGPANESGQSLTITTTTDHPEYFDLAGQPAVDASGTLTYTPALGAFGVAAVTVTVRDDGGVANGGSDTVSTTFTITIAALPPIAGDDSYTTTTLGGGLHVAAPGVLVNDADVNSGTLAAVPFTNVPTAAGGTASLQADGTFDYSPPLSLFSFNDTVGYQVIDGAGQTATATISIAVTLLPAGSNTLYLDTSGLSADVWNLVASPVGAVAPVPDLDGDSDPGLTIDGSDGKEQVSEAKKQRAWAHGTGLLGLSLHGPLTLHLTAATENFGIGKAETVYLYVYDCPAGASTISTLLCTKLASNEVLVPQWNTTATYATHDVTAAVDADLLPARQLRIRVLIRGAKLWIPLVGPYGSSIDYTG